MGATHQAGVSPHGDAGASVILRVEGRIMPSVGKPLSCESS